MTQSKDNRKRTEFRQIRRVLALCILFGSACTPREQQPDVTGPEPENDLVVTADTATPEVFQDQTVTLTATADGGTAPYLFRWDQNSGPEEIDLANAVTATITTEDLSTPGRYVFRVTVTDSDGIHESDFVSVQVASPVELEVPRLAITGTPTMLSATVQTEGEATVEWEVTRGSAALDDPLSLTPMLTTLAAETVVLTLSVMIPGSNETPNISSHVIEIASVESNRPRVQVETNLGTMVFELDGEAAPLHTANFLLHVDDDFYDDVLFHRNACRQVEVNGSCEPFVLQGGGYERMDGELILKEPTRSPVTSEADNGLSNGTVHSIALALSGSNPNSGTTQFFINLAEGNRFLDDQGFTVFGQVVEGAEVVDALVAVPTVESPILPAEESLPSVDIIILRMSRLRS
ncbi:MAG: peptidylprolyl isomerase [Planctomycetota bacterium]